MNNLLEIVLSIVSTAFATGGISGLLLFKYKKRSAKLENDNAVITQWQQLVKILQERYDLEHINSEQLTKRQAELQEQTTILYERINKLQYEKSKLMARDDKITTENVKLNLLQCRDISCPSRKPPFNETINL